MKRHHNETKRYEVTRLEKAAMAKYKLAKSIPVINNSCYYEFHEGSQGVIHDKSYDISVIIKLLLE